MGVFLAVATGERRSLPRQTGAGSIRLWELNPRQKADAVERPFRPQITAKKRLDCPLPDDRLGALRLSSQWFAATRNASIAYFQ